MSIKGNAKSYVELRGSLSLPEAIHGKSAYELAVMHGFEGTEADWLHQLRYAKDGVDGLTPYIGENGDWWIGNTDTGIIAGTPKYMCGTELMYEGETSLAPNKVYFLIEGDDDIPLTYLSAVASGTEEIGGAALEVGTVYFKYDEGGEDSNTVTFTINNAIFFNGGTVPKGTTWGDWVQTTFIEDEDWNCYEWGVNPYDNSITHDLEGGWLSDADGNQVYAHDVIVDGGVYERIM